MVTVTTCDSELSLAADADSTVTVSRQSPAELGTTPITVAAVARTKLSGSQMSINGGGEILRRFLCVDISLN